MSASVSQVLENAGKCCCACFSKVLRTEPRTLQMLVSTPPTALHPQSFFGLDNPVPVTPLSSFPPPPPPPHLWSFVCRETAWKRDMVTTTLSLLHDSHETIISLVQPKKAQGRDQQGHLVTVWQGWDFGMKDRKRLLSS